MHLDYISYLFHKESGMALSTYILNERIALVRKLLLSSANSNQTVSD